MSWVYLDDKFPEHRKVEAAGGDAAWLFVCALAYCKRNGTGGLIPKTAIPRLSDRKQPHKLADRLVRVELFERFGDQYRIHDYDDWNRSELKRSAAGRKAAAKRWHKPEDANAYANASDSYSERNADPMHARPTPTPTPVTDSVPPLSSVAPNAVVVGEALRIIAERCLAARKADPQQERVKDDDLWMGGLIDKKREQVTAAHLAQPAWSALRLADQFEPEPAPKWHPCGLNGCRDGWLTDQFEADGELVACECRSVLARVGKRA